MSSALFRLALILLSTKLFGIVTGKFQMPRVVGALLAGLILGPAVLTPVLLKLCFGGQPMEAAARNTLTDRYHKADSWS